MSVWDDLTNSLGAIPGAIGTGLNDLSNFVGGSSANAVNGVRPSQDLNLFSKIGLGLQGNQAVQNYNQSYNLQNLGSQLANGNIDQTQYMKSLAQYSPDEYNKLTIAQIQGTPAAVKTFNDIENLKKQGLDAYQNGDIAKAKDFIDQANLLTGVSRPAYAGSNMFTLPTGGQPTTTQPNPNAITTGRYPSLQGDNTVAVQDLPPGGNAQPIVSSNNPAVSPQPMPANEVLNNTPGMTDSEKVAAKLPTSPVPSPIPQPPARQPGQTELQHKTDIKAWEDQNAAYVSEQKASGGDTVKYDAKISSDAKDSQNVINAIADMRKAQAQIQSGALAPAQQTMLRWSRAVGVDLSPDQLANLNNQQVMTKLSNDILGGVLKNDGQAGRLKSVADSAKAANPNIGMEPEALNSLFDYIQTKAAPVIEEQKAWAAAKTANPSLTAAEFRRQNVSERSNAQEAAGGALPGYKGNSNPVGLPEGTKTNPDGTLTLPNGQIIRKKK